MKYKELVRQFDVISQSKPEIITVLGMNKKQFMELQKFLQKLSENVYEYELSTKDNNPIFLIANRNPSPQ